MKRKKWTQQAWERYIDGVIPDEIPEYPDVTFAVQIRAAAGALTASQIAAATGASKRTVEGWRAGKEPPQAYRADILTRIKRARARAERRATGRDAGT